MKKQAAKQQTSIQPQKAPRPGGLSSELKLIGKKVKEARERKFLQLREAAKAAGVSEQWLSDLEKGFLENATFSKIYSITEAVGLTFVPQVH